MLEIERLSWLKPRYAVRDERGHEGIWTRRRFKEPMIGHLDGQAYEFARRGRKQFVLVAGDGRLLATADAGRRGRWLISAGESTYELRRRSAWRSEMELRQADVAVGSVRKGKAARGKIVCDLPADLGAPVQAFVGFVVMTLWDRSAANSGATVVAAAG